MLYIKVAIMQFECFTLYTPGLEAHCDKKVTRFFACKHNIQVDLL
jgi:hypothetical protein